MHRPLRFANLHRWGVLLALAIAAAVPAFAAGSAPLAVSAIVLSKSNCKFSSNAAQTLDFGTINPASTSTITVSVSRTFTCNGSAPMASFSVSAGSGLYPSGSVRRMRHGATFTEFMAYGLSVSPTSATVAKGSTQTLTITGTLSPDDFANVLAGVYSDTVSISLTP